MKIRAALIATAVAAMPLCAQPPAPAQGAAEKPAEAPPADGAAASAGADKPAATPEPETAPEGTTPDKPAADPTQDPAH